MCCGFQKDNKHMYFGQKFTKKWFGPYKVQFCLLNDIVINHNGQFDLNLILVNMNK
jgi:hypothetical protein